MSDNVCSVSDPKPTRNGKSASSIRATPLRVPLKFAIVQSGLTQTQIARHLNIQPSRLSGIVRGWTEPRAEERRELSRVLKVAQETLFG